jgi:hypothetical protein
MGRSWYLVFIFGCILLGARAADVYVSSNGVDADTCGTDAAPCASLAVAVPKLTSAGDKIIISGIITGANTVNVTITQDLTIKSLTGNPEVDLLDGAGFGPIFRVWNVSNTTSYSIAFDGIGIRNFNASMNPFNNTDGGVIAIYECILCKVSLTNVVLSNNTARRGAVVWMYVERHSANDPSGLITLNNVTAIGNSASNAGSVVYAYGNDLQVQSLKASSNYAGESGGVLYVEHQAKVTITGSYFADNNVGDFGGALGFNEFIKAYTNNTVFVNNHAADEGGAVFAYTTDSYFTNCNFTNNRGGDGGAILARRYSYAQADNCEFTGNNGGYGGAIFAQERSGIRSNNSKFTRNKAAFGGALAWLTTSKGTVIASRFESNIAQRGGALFLQYNNLLALMSSDLDASNNATEFGAQIYCSGSSIDINTTNVAGNQTPGNVDQAFYCANQPAGTICTIRGEDPFAGSCDTSVLGNIADSITDSQTTALIIGLCVALGCAAIIIVVSIVMAKKLRRVRQAAPEDKQQHMWAALDDPSMESPRPAAPSQPAEPTTTTAAAAPASRPASVRASSPLDWYDNPEAQQESDSSSV